MSHPKPVDFSALRDAAHPAFDPKGFERVVDALRREAAKPGEVLAVEPARVGDIHPLPEPGSRAAAELRKLGEQALRAGQLGLIVVAGGAGTRFGGGVKALVAFLGEHTFLD